MIRIGVLGTANIAERRMVPAVLKHPDFEYIGVATAAREETGTDCTEEAFLSIQKRKAKRAEDFAVKFGGETVIGYENMLKRTDIDAVYIPLPPALHFKWIMLALQYGKHVISEKPLTVRAVESQCAVREAEERSLALIENYGFCYHHQMKLIQEYVRDNSIGNIRLIRASFCFPHREESDFRYSKGLGGGALLDCGGYTVKAASIFLGPSSRIISQNLVITPGHEVDIYGSATMRNKDGLCAQLSFGMDNAYICELEVWGSTGTVKAARAFTAPDGYGAPVIIRQGNNTEERMVADDQFFELLTEFEKCIGSSDRRIQEYDNMLLQSRLVEEIGQNSESFEMRVS